MVGSELLYIDESLSRLWSGAAKSVRTYTCAWRSGCEVLRGDEKEARRNFTVSCDTELYK